MSGIRFEAIIGFELESKSLTATAFKKLENLRKTNKSKLRAQPLRQSHDPHRTKAFRFFSSSVNEEASYVMFDNISPETVACSLPECLFRLFSVVLFLQEYRITSELWWLAIVRWLSI